jgi:hypothetical protein
MFNTNSPRFVSLLAGLILCTAAVAQDNKETVILYNTQPVRAEITPSGEVIRVISEEPDFLKGFTLKIPDYAQHVAVASAIKETESVKIPSSQAYSIESGDNILVPFDPGFATLSDKAISKLDQAIKILNQDRQAVALIRTFSIVNDSPLHKNRLNSVSAYFRIRGVDSSRFVFENLTGDRNFDEINISFIR